jgi:pSer/pThr/pTyr-binding forkhead associated (FHA) protein
VTPSGQIPLVPGDNVVGRDPQARIWLDSPSVSRRHAIIHVDESGATVEDLESKNGTHLRNERLDAVTPLTDGDTVRFGSIAVTFRAWLADPTRTEAGPA